MTGSDRPSGESDRPSGGVSHVDDYTLVGDCAGCGGQMIEIFAAEKDDERRVTFRCQDCDAEAELRHDFEDGLEGGSWSGVVNPETKPVSWIDCPRCHGYGEIEDPICDLRRAMNGREHPCPNCDATGSVPRVVETDGGVDRPGDEVTHYTTTGFESWVYCDTSCLRRAIGPDTDRAGGAADV